MPKNSPPLALGEALEALASSTEISRAVSYAAKTDRLWRAQG